MTFDGYFTTCLLLLTIDIDLGEYNPNISNKPACLRYPRNNNVTINNLNTGEISWYNESSNKSINKNSYEILFKNDTLKPWILILKR